jgi:hypothetical protein
MKMFGMENSLKNRFILIIIIISKISFGQTKTSILLQVNPKVNYVIGNKSYENSFLTPLKPSFGLSLDLGLKKVYKSNFQIDYVISYNCFQLMQKKRQLNMAEPIWGSTANGRNNIDYFKTTQVKSIDLLIWLGFVKKISPKIFLETSFGGGYGYVAETKIKQTFKSPDDDLENVYIDYLTDKFARKIYYVGIKCGLSWNLSSKMSSFILANYIQNLNTFYLQNNPLVYPNSRGISIGLGYSLKGKEK